MDSQGKRLKGDSDVVNGWRQLRVGVDPWAPRATGRCVWHTGYTEHLFNDHSEESMEEYVHRGMAGPVVTITDNKLRHGDGWAAHAASEHLSNTCPHKRRQR